MLNKGYHCIYKLRSVQDVTWLSGQSVHVAKWMHALEQIPDFHERHLTKFHTWALSQVITHTGDSFCLWLYVIQCWWLTLYQHWSNVCCLMGGTHSSLWKEGFANWRGDIIHVFTSQAGCEDLSLAFAFRLNASRGSWSFPLKISLIWKGLFWVNLVGLEQKYCLGIYRE